jgi:hypothetical protein
MLKIVVGAAVGSLSTAAVAVFGNKGKQNEESAEK